MDFETVIAKCEKMVNASYPERQSAIRDLDVLIKENPRSGKLYYFKAHYCYRMELYESWKTVVEWLDTAIKYGYETSDVHYCKSEILMLAEQDKDALNSLDKVLEVVPDHTYALYDKGMILMDNLKHDDALACLNKIKQKSENVYIMMAEMYLDKNMDDKADQYLNVALSIQGTTDTSKTAPLLDRIQRRKKYRKEKTYNQGAEKKLDHLQLEQYFSKQRRMDLIKWTGQTKSTPLGSNSHLDRLHKKIRNIYEPWKGGSGLFLQAELIRTLWSSTRFSVTDVEHNYKMNNARNIDIDMELDGKLCIQVWSAIRTEGLIMLGDFDSATEKINLERGLTTEHGGLGGDPDRDWIGLEDKLNQLPDDRPEFVVVGYPIWITTFRYHIEPKYCQGMPANKCVIVLNIDLKAASLTGQSTLYYHPKCTCVDMAKDISKEMGFEPSAHNPLYPLP